MALLDSSSRPHLHQRHVFLLHFCKHFEEQKIEQLDVAELTQVQHQLDAILRQTRIKKSQLMMKAVTALHEKNSWDRVLSIYRVYFSVSCSLKAIVTCCKGTEEWRVQWKEGALNDISISGRPSTLQTSKKQNPKNVISIGEDIGPSKMTSFGGKRNVSKAPEKEQAGGWKALTDLKNSGKHPHQASKKNGYSMQLGSPLSGKLKPESPLWYLEMEEMFELSMKINLNGRSLVYKVLVVVLLEVPNHPRLCCCLRITTLPISR
ncbi:hypothetical protein ACSBR2_026066 [Camellia fascicularis]